MALVEEWMRLRQERQQQTAQRSAQVQETLATLNAQRTLESEQLRNELRQYRASLAQNSAARQLDLQAYVLRLHQQIQDLLTLNAAQRAIAATQFQQELHQFLDPLKAQTQADLQHAQQQRRQQAQQLQQALSDFETHLSADVQTLLQDYQLLRQSRAQQLQQQLAQARSARLVQAQALGEQLTQLRSLRQQEHQALKTQVWGNAPVVPSPTATRRPKVTVIAPPTRPPARVSPPALKHSAPSLEEKVHNYIVRSPGSRLTDIESQLGLNRVQTVDLLSALIRKGSIVQRDRLYFPN
ncbi:MAG: hypothetical protein LRZ84_04135 [Desertifilum sp.]|nr:hypothetical protein [Desertifilum sp.]